MKLFFLIALFLLASFAGIKTASAQNNLISDVRIDFSTYVGKSAPTDTLLDYFCVITMSDANAHPTLNVKAGSDSTADKLSDHFDHVFYVDTGYVSGVNPKSTQTGVNNSLSGNTVRIYLGRYHFELLYCLVEAKDDNGNSVGIKAKDMRVQ